ncbi:hypothetical protein F4677DRAFT_440837 [Hypoxylon crocopeplum]|nr:hypothetical protein F4677DRAFT_440837 [Hypoxylon crocopeplum]
MRDIPQSPPSSYHPRDLEDWQRDVPQSLLFPHSLNPTAPGRQVLLRNQQVLLAAPTPPPTISPLSEDVETGMEQVPASSSSMLARVQRRLKDAWTSIQQRAFPPQYRYAGLVFTFVIMIAGSAIAFGWYSLMTETDIDQQSTSSLMSSPKTTHPAESSTEVPSTSAMVTIDLSAVPFGYFETTTTQATASAATLAASTAPAGPCEVEVDLDPHHLASLDCESVAETKTVKQIDTTVVVIQTVYPPPHSSSAADFSISSDTTMPVTSSVVSSAASDPATLMALSVVSSTAAPTTFSTTSTPSLTTTATTTAMAMTSDDLLYCPYSKYPDVWTLCDDSIVPWVAAPISPPTQSPAARRMWNPFSAVRAGLASLWNAVSTSEWVRAVLHIRQPDAECNCRCHDLQRRMRASLNTLSLHELFFIRPQNRIQGHPGILDVEFRAAMHNFSRAAMTARMHALEDAFR